MQYNSYEVTYNKEIAYWWFKARLKIFESLYERILLKSKKAENIKILNVGCGTGITTNRFSEYGEIISLDYSEEALKYCRLRKLVRLIRSDAEALPFKDGSFDAALYFDIIEHLDDDKNAIREMKRTLAKDGYAIISVPAFKFLWSSFDDINWHKRRYNKKTLKKLLTGADLEIVKLSYFNFFLFPVALIRRFYEKLFKRKQVDYYIPDVGKLTNFLFYRLFSLERYLLRFFNFPWGVSLIAIVKNNSRG